MTSKESEVLLTELIVMAEVGDAQKQDEAYTVETINNVSYIFLVCCYMVVIKVYKVLYLSYRPSL